MTRSMRMAELVRESGIPRETIHYYLREGLLPEPRRSGRTRATYDERHLERLRAIRYLREEKFLPIAVIRSMFEVGLQGGGLDVETVATVLGLDPSLPQPPGQLAHHDDVLAVALERGLLGGSAEPAAIETPAALAVLAAVAEATQLEPGPRELSLADMSACAPALQRLVEAEAAAFFSYALATGALGRSVDALARGRGAVARYVAAYRSFALQQVVTRLLDAAGDMRLAKVRILELGPATLKRLAPQWTDAASSRSGSGHDWVWHLLATGQTSRLPELPPAVVESLRPRTLALVVLLGGAGPLKTRRHLESPLGQILVAEIELKRALQSTADGRLERLVRGLSALTRARPGDDADPTAAALGALRRGLILSALPTELGLMPQARSDLTAVVQTIGSAPGRVEPAARVCMEANARYFLAQLHGRGGRWDAAGRELERADAFADDGELGAAVRSQREALVMAQEHDSWPVQGSNANDV